MAMWTDRFSIEFDDDEDVEGHLTLSLLNDIEEAYIGVVYHPNGPPVACYSHPIAAAIISSNWNISIIAASNLIDYLSQNAKGKSPPAFLKT
mgnify:FL=1